MDAFLEKRVYDSGLIVWSRSYENLRFLPHYHRETELIYIRSGSAHINVAGVNLLCREGDLVICRGGNTHYSNDERDSNVMDFIIFDPMETERMCPMRKKLPPVVRAEDMARVGMDKYCEKVFDVVHQELEKREEGWETLVRLEIAGLTARLIRYFRVDGGAHTALGGAGVFDRLGRLMEYLESNYSQPIRLADAAAVMGYEPTYCSRVFKTLTGMSFSEYLGAVRVGKAIDMLRAEGGKHTDIAGIALRCGFEVRNFNRVFKAATGMTPSEFAATGALPSRPSSGLYYDTSPTVSYKCVVR